MEGKLIYSLYRFLQAIGLPLIVLYFLRRGWKDRRYFRYFGERLGLLPPSLKRTMPGCIWLHAVSVGEVISCAGLLRRLKEETPARSVFVSCTTLAGRAMAEEKLRGVADGVFYAPVDYCFAVRRVLRSLRPAAVVVMETEIWPNLYREAKRFGCSLLLVNARISDGALPRYARLAWFFRPVLRLPDAILAQSADSRARFIQLGAPEDRVSQPGNLKYDFEPRHGEAPEAVQRLLDILKPPLVWIAASTMPPAHASDVDEDEAVIAAFQELCRAHPGLFLILVPRKPERFDAVADKLQRAGLSFARRSTLGEDGRPAARAGGLQALLLDSIGELSSLFPVADVVFMGGSLNERGGHNILEPAFFSRPVVIGPHMENFPEIEREFTRGGGVVRIGGAGELAGAIDALLRDPGRRAALGEQARRLAEARRGAVARVAGDIEHQYTLSVPVSPRSGALYPLLWPLSQVWRAGSAFKRKRDLWRQGRLRTPVVSVGGIGMGGAGKSPFALWLAGRFRDARRSPAILTRGYLRESSEKITILEAGATAFANLTGDEAQIFLRSGLAAVGIGADRLAAGRLLEQRSRPGVFILDDGFQHWRLERDLDIVLIDALDPFAGGSLFPLGRLREPLTELARADAFVITRTQRGRRLRGIEMRLREYNAAAPVFYSRVVPGVWVDAESGDQWSAVELPFAPVAAFCGLANPAAFWQTLAELGCRPEFQRVFPDHHKYEAGELKRLAANCRAAGVKVLLTTEKDLMNLPDDAAQMLAPVKLRWLKIGIEVDNQEALLALIEERIGRGP